MNTWVGPGDDSYDPSMLESGRRPHKESFEDPAWHNEDTHEIWTPPSRCITCGGHRVSRVRGMQPVSTRHLGFWAWLAELPMRWLARSLRKRDSRYWRMEERTPHPDTATDLHHFGTKIHEQIEQYYLDEGDRKELGPE